MTEMIALIAEAIRLRSCERGYPVHPAVAHHLAAAAIEAMREPPDQILLAAGEPYGGRVEQSVGLEARRGAWNKMIDAALTSHDGAKT